MAIKSANVIARVDPRIKKEAEEIINDLGLNASSIINALYRQIIINKGIPFNIKKEPINIDDISDDELSMIVARRIENFEKNGEGIPAEKAFEDLLKKFENDKKKTWR